MIDLPHSGEDCVGDCPELRSGLRAGGRVVVVGAVARGAEALALAHGADEVMDICAKCFEYYCHNAENFSEYCAEKAVRSRLSAAFDIITFERT